MKKLAYVLVATLVLGLSLASAIHAQAPTSSVSISIPPELFSIVPEQEFVELIGLEARAKGGEAVAILEALDELLEQLGGELSAEGIELQLPAAAPYAQELRARLDAIAAAPTVAEAQSRLQAYIDRSRELESELRASFTAQLEQEVTAAFTSWAEEYRTRVTQELQEEGERLGQEAMEGLQAQARAEAEAAKEALITRLQAEIEAEIRAKYGNKQSYTPQEIAELQQLGYNIGMQRGAEEAARIRAELEAKYQQLADEARERITRQLEEKARQLEAEARARLEAYGNRFRSLEADARQLAASRMSEWNQYAEQARQKKRAILRTIIEHYLAEAKAEIEANRGEIDEAFVRGKIDVSTDDLLARLEADFEEIFNRLDSADLTNPASYRAIEAEFRQKWQQVRQSLERARAQSVEDIMAQVDQQVPFDALKTRLNMYVRLRETLLTNQDNWRKWTSEPPNPRWNEWFACLVERARPILYLHDAMVDKGIALAGQAEHVLAIVSQYEAFKEDPSNVSVDALLELLGELQAAFDSYLQAEREYNTARSPWQEAVHQYYRECKQQTGGK